MVRLSACLKAVTALTVEMTHKEQNQFKEPGTFIEVIGPSRNRDIPRVHMSNVWF